MAKRKATEEEIANDPSLKWNQYHRWEPLWSDVHERIVRFDRYEVVNGKELIRVCEVNSLAPLPLLLEPLQVRTTVQQKEREASNAKGTLNCS